MSNLPSQRQKHESHLNEGSHAFCQIRIFDESNPLFSIIRDESLNLHASRESAIAYVVATFAFNFLIRAYVCTRTRRRKKPIRDLSDRSWPLFDQFSMFRSCVFFFLSRDTAASLFLCTFLPRDWLLPQRGGSFAPYRPRCYLPTYHVFNVSFIIGRERERPLSFSLSADDLIPASQHRYHRRLLSIRSRGSPGKIEREKERERERERERSSWSLVWQSRRRDADARSASLDSWDSARSKISPVRCLPTHPRQL